jgi:putative transposase
VLNRFRFNSDAGSQYTSIRFTETLALQSLPASIGSIGDAYDNAVAESFMGLSKNEAIAAGSPFGPGRCAPGATSKPSPGTTSTGTTTTASTACATSSPEEFEQVYYAHNTGPPSGDAANKKTA